MKHKDQLRHQEFLRWYLNLPNQMLALKSRSNVTEFVLHALCNQKCFNLEKAAYFVDNLAFDCFKGIAGFDRREEYSEPLTIWSTPDQFSEHMRSCSFNQKVRSIETGSMKKANHHQSAIVSELSGNLEFNNPIFFRWNIKHDNEGILLFQLNEGHNYEEEFLEGLCLLGFCPIF
jgi:hypothetical protein